MAIRFDAAGDAVALTSGGVPGAAHTASFWYYVAADINAAGTVYAHFPDGAGAAWSGVYMAASGTALYIESTGTSSAGSTPVNVGQWYRVTYRRNGSAHSLFVDGALAVSHTGAVAADTAPALAIGGNTVNYTSARFAHLALFNSALTDAQIALLAKLSRPHAVATPYAYYPMFPGADRLQDFSGNGRHLSLIGGSVTDEDGPPASYGAPVRVYYHASAALPTLQIDHAVTEDADAHSSTAVANLVASAAQSDGADTQSATAAAALSITASQSDGADTQAATAAANLAASHSVTEGADTQDATILVGFIEHDVTEGADAQSATVNALLAAASSVTEGADSQAAIAQANLVASASQADGADAQVAEAILVSEGITHAVTEGDDAQSATALALLQAIHAVTEGEDALASLVESGLGPPDEDDDEPAEAAYAASPRGMRASRAALIAHQNRRIIELVTTLVASGALE